MQPVNLLYSNSRLPLSPIIRWRTKSPWSHSALLLETGKITDNSLLIESTLSHGGVHFATLGEFKSRSKNWCLTELNEKVRDFDRLKHEASMQEGKPYDLEGAIGLGLNEDWQDDDKWWCSEIVAFILKQGGMHVMDWQNVHRITPKDNWLWQQKVVALSL